MKSTFKYIFALLAVYSLSAGSVLADSALVIGLDGCGLLDGDGVGTSIDSTGITVSASSSNGNVMHTCSATVKPASNGRSAIFSGDSTGRSCGLDNGYGGNLAVTDDWHEVVSASGKAKIVCHFKN